MIRSIFMIILCFLSSLSNAQEMKDYLNKEITANVGSICEETPDDNPCAGIQIYLTFIFDENKVSISEKEISSCGKKHLNKIGSYNWKLLSNKEISINFDLKEIKNTYAGNLFLELRDKKIIGRITHLNNTISEYVFKEE